MNLGSNSDITLPNDSTDQVDALIAQVTNQPEIDTGSVDSVIDSVTGAASTDSTTDTGTLEEVTVSNTSLATYFLMAVGALALFGKVKKK